MWHFSLSNSGLLESSRLSVGVVKQTSLEIPEFQYVAGVTFDDVYAIGLMYTSATTKSNRTLTFKNLNLTLNVLV